MLLMLLMLLMLSQGLVRMRWNFADIEELEEVQAATGGFDTVPSAVVVAASHSMADCQATTVFLVQSKVIQLVGRKASPNSKEWADPQEEEQTCLPRDR